ncbi:LysR substrate-binding domain-containing protein [Kutzneria kofuensis]
MVADLNLRLLRYFAAVGAERHIGRAAQRLFITQPALSKQIHRLEDELGVRLVKRVGRGIDLTEAGQALLDVVPALLDHADEVLETVVRTGNGRHGRVRLGFVPGATALASDLLRDVGHHLPDLDMESCRVGWVEPGLSLLRDEVDLCLLRPPIDEAGLSTHRVLSEPRVAGFHADHPLAGATELRIAQLRDEPVIDTSFQRDYWAVDPRPDGTVPRRGPRADSVEDMLAIVAAGQAMCITSASIASMFPGPAVSFVPISDIAPTEVHLAWRTGDLSPAAARVVHLVVGGGHSRADRCSAAAVTASSTVASSS